jgi:hypothetical protein
MITVSDRETRGARAVGLNRAIPVEMIENDGQDRAWLNLSGEWVKVVSVRNLWDIDGHSAGEKPWIHMHFQVEAESGRRLLLFQDLMDGSWYREVTLGPGA